MKYFGVGLYLYVALSLMAKDKPKIRIEVVGSNTSEREYSQYLPGTASHSTTNCSGSATANTNGNATANTIGNTTTVYGNATTTANGNANCYTTTTPGQAPQTVIRSIQQVHVRAIMADGRHITLWCQAGFRHCDNLSAGVYEADADGNALWIYAYDLSNKVHKRKYRYVGGW